MVECISCVVAVIRNNFVNIHQLVLRSSDAALVGKELRVEYAQSNTSILLCLTARILHVTPYHYKKHNGDDAHQNYDCFSC